MLSAFGKAIAFLFNRLRVQEHFIKVFNRALGVGFKGIVRFIRSGAERPRLLRSGLLQRM